MIFTSHSFPAFQLVYRLPGDDWGEEWDDNSWGEGWSEGAMGVGRPSLKNQQFSYRKL